MMMHYGAERLSIRRFVAKIGLDNGASLALFKGWRRGPRLVARRRRPPRSGLGFAEKLRCDHFREATLELSADALTALKPLWIALAPEYRESGAQASALVLVSSGPPAFEERHVPLPTEGCVVEIVAATVCASDIHSADGRRAPCRDFDGHGCTLGHEGTGTLLTVPEGRPDLAPGDVVVWGVAASCGSTDPLVCLACAKGVEQKCTSLYKYGHEPCVLLPAARRPATCG